MTVYLDIIFLENLLMNYIILFATGIILKKDIKIFRLIVASSFGSIYAIITYVFKLEILSNFILKIILSILIIYIAYNTKKVKELLKILLIFYLTSFTFGGVAFALIYFIKPQNILIRNGMLVGTYPMKIVIFAGLLGFIILNISFKIIKGKITKKNMYCDLKIIFENKTCSVSAILDTGNFLVEPISKIPVIVTEKSKLEYILPKEILDNIDDIINGNTIGFTKYQTKIRLIPYTSLGKQNGMLVGMRVDGVLINFEEKSTFVKDIIIGVCNGLLSKTGKYSALIGIDLIDSVN